MQTTHIIMVVATKCNSRKPKSVSYCVFAVLW